MFDETRLGARTNRRENGDPLREAAPEKHRHAGRLAKRVLAGIVVVTSACGSTADPCAETSVTSCEVDGYEASCGGTGEPTVAGRLDRDLGVPESLTIRSNQIVGFVTTPESAAPR